MNVPDSAPPPAGTARRALDDLPNLISLLVFVLVTAFLFRSWEFALLVAASIGIHELGHAALLAHFGLEWRISFGVLGAWTWSPQAGRARLSNLANASIHLAGPLFSLLFALLAIFLQGLWRPGDDRLLLLANFSAQVGFLNLLPVGDLTDGGKVVRRVVNSLDKSNRTWAMMLPMLVSAMMMSVYALVEMPRLEGADHTPILLGLLVGLWMASSMLIESRKARREGRTGRMTQKQIYFVLLAMWAMLILGMGIAAATPFWLSPKYLIGTLHNVADVLRLFDYRGPF